MRDEDSTFRGGKGDAVRGEASTSECVEIRREIMAALSEGGAFSAIVSTHLVKCPPCRDWEGEFRAMHTLCRESKGALDPSRLTSSILNACETEPRGTTGRLAAPAPGAGKALDRGALLVAFLFVVLFQAILAFLLEGSSRIVYPAVCAVVMMLPAVWVYGDAAKRGMPAGFWAALQPFTVPVGFAAYLVCRERATARCPACGAARPNRSVFCAECGGKLVDTCCGCGKPVRKEFRICPFCGTRLEQCFPREDAGAPCGWSRRQIVFLAAVNAALVAALVAVLLRGDAQRSILAALLYLFGFFPIFNWVSIDARRRAMNGVAWGAFALVASYPGLVIYLACRKDERIVCPVCGSHPPASFNFCPCCGSLLRSSCERCGTAAASGDRFCSSCGAEIS